MVAALTKSRAHLELVASSKKVLCRMNALVGMQWTISNSSQTRNASHFRGETGNAIPARRNQLGSLANMVPCTELQAMMI
jgi:hypothetical protein